MILGATPLQAPPPDQFAELCACCWKRRATRTLRSRGGWNIGACDKCYSRLAAEPFLRPAEDGNPHTAPIGVTMLEDGRVLHGTGWVLPQDYSEAEVADGSLPSVKGATPEELPTLGDDQADDDGRGG